MRISDWSSDVCSSDLGDRARLGDHRHARRRPDKLCGGRRDHRWRQAEGGGDRSCRDRQRRRRRIAVSRPVGARSEEHTSELQSLMRISYAVFCLKKKTNKNTKTYNTTKQYRKRTY